VFFIPVEIRSPFEYITFGGDADNWTAAIKIAKAFEE
jgi:hypothetical protein